jgi:hypothetical protein
MTHEHRQACFYAQQELRTLLREWQATSHDIKRGVIQDAIVALSYVPLPDDLAEAAQHAPESP